MIYFCAVFALLHTVVASSFDGQGNEYIPYDGEIKPVVLTPEPYTYLTEEDLPASFDWRNINGTNFCSKVSNQKNPNVCGSCWAHATTGALTDRYKIATNNQFNVQLSPQNLINFGMRITGGTCEGGDHVKAYEFMYNYGISDDVCMPYQGLNWKHGFHVAGMTDVEDVQAHQCHTCSWDGNCGFIPRSGYDLYGVDEFGWVRGEEQMKAEIFARGPVACSVNSSPNQFKHYQGGIISCNNPKECKGIYTHLVVINGWGVDKDTGKKYWIGRNSYGTQWGEGIGGGSFRIERGTNTLQIENGLCAWAVPAKADVERSMNQFYESL